MRTNKPIKVTKYRKNGELIKVYESYAEAGRDGSFHPASLGYAFKVSQIKDFCEYKGFVWTRNKDALLTKNKTEADESMNTHETDWTFAVVAFLALAFTISMTIVILQS